MKPAAFARAQTIARMIDLAFLLPLGEQQAALSKIPEYRSRGKGRGTPSRRYGNPPGKYVPHQGKQECARRAARGW